MTPERVEPQAAPGAAPALGHPFDIARLDATPLARDPYDHVIVPGFVTEAALEAAHRDYPAVDKPGSFPLEDVTYGPGFARLVEALDGPEFEAAIERKFGLSLSGLPTVTTVRARCRASDGKIHTDTPSKVITVLVYMNPAWEAAGGRLRLLRSATDLNAVAAEVPPVAGTLLVFRRSDTSWHGHESFEGPRRAIQFNWVSEQRWVDRERRRHRLSAAIKRLNPFS
jgi:hypothetical protein